MVNPACRRKACVGAQIGVQVRGINQRVQVRGVGQRLRSGVQEMVLGEGFGQRASGQRILGERCRSEGPGPVFWVRGCWVRDVDQRLPGKGCRSEDSRSGS